MSAALQMIESRSLEQSQAMKKPFREQGGHILHSADRRISVAPSSSSTSTSRWRKRELSSDLVFGIAFHEVLAGFYTFLEAEQDQLSSDKLLSDTSASPSKPIAPLRQLRTRTLM